MSKPKGTDSIPDLHSAMARLREIAAQAGDHLLLGDGPPHPDARLLELCADAVQLLRTTDHALDTCRQRAESEDYDEDEARRLGGVCVAASKNATAVMKRIAKLPARTGAGIYAKAMVVRASREGAPKLAMTLAEDLIACHALRASLWDPDPEPPAEMPGNVVALAPRTARKPEA